MLVFIIMLLFRNAVYIIFIYNLLFVDAKFACDVHQVLLAKKLQLVNTRGRCRGMNRIQDLVERYSGSKLHSNSFSLFSAQANVRNVAAVTPVFWVVGHRHAT